jgi:hypothetical protein
MAENMAHTHFQHTRGKKGSPGQVSIAQNGIGKRIQFKPAPAISAMSCSVYMCDQPNAAAEVRKGQEEVSAIKEETPELRLTTNVS